MFLPPRIFSSKNRRTSPQMTPRRLSGQSVEDQIRSLQSAWGDILSLPLCLVVLALYEWWRWLFSIPSNPLLLTLMAAVAVRATWRRRKVYKAELNQLRMGKPAQPTAQQLLEALCTAASRLWGDITDKIALWNIPASARRALSPASWLAKRLTARS
jgi:hypothetical protein